MDQKEICFANIFGSKVTSPRLLLLFIVKFKNKNNEARFFEDF